MEKKTSKKEIKITREKTTKIIDKIINGTISVPSFQRDYVWTKKKIEKFLNSLINFEPFGTILLWIPSEQKVNLGFRNEIIESLKDKKRISESFLIDGQQRLTSLILIRYFKKLKENTLKSSSKLKPKGWDIGELIKFDYKNNEFIIVKKNDKRPNVIDSDILWEDEFDHEKIRNIIAQNNVDTHESSKIADKINVLVNNIKQIESSIIKLDGHSLDEVITIFSNVNNQGTKLTTFDLVHAKWSIFKKTDGTYFELKDEIINITKNWANGYDKLSTSIFMDCLYLSLDDNNEPIYTSEKKLSFNIESWEIDKVVKKFEEIKKSYEKTYKFLREVMSMQHNFLPSDIIFKWLTYFFHKSKTNLNGQQTDIIKEYIKLSCINNRYRSSTLQKLEQDIAFVKDVLLSNDPYESWKAYNKKKSFRDNEITDEQVLDITYKENSMMAKYIKYILFNQTESFQNGAKHSFTDVTDMHHIFPKKCEYVKINNIEEDLLNSIVNLTPLNKTENQIIGNKNPSVYYNDLEKTSRKGFEESLKNHGINSEFLKNNNFEALIEHRKKYISNLVNK